MHRVERQRVRMPMPRRSGQCSCDRGRASTPSLGESRSVVQNAVSLRYPVPNYQHGTTPTILRLIKATPNSPYCPAMGAAVRRRSAPARRAGPGLPMKPCKSVARKVTNAQASQFLRRSAAVFVRCAGRRSFPAHCGAESAAELIEFVANPSLRQQCPQRQQTSHEPPGAGNGACG